MYQCELFSVQINKTDPSALKDAEKELSATLATSGAELKEITPVKEDSYKLDAAVSKKLVSGGSDLFLFANAIKGDDDASFRRLFYRLIRHLESDIQKNDDQKELTPKLKVSSIGDLGNGNKGYCFSFRGKRFIALPCASLTGKDVTQLIRDALHEAEEVFKNNADKYPEGIAFFDADGNEADASLNRGVTVKDPTMPQKQGFIRSFIPSKEDTKKQKRKKIAVLIMMAVIVIALGVILKIFVFDSLQNRAVMSKIQSIGHPEDLNEDGKSEDLVMDWDALKKINDEIVGWIHIPDTVIDYPVLYHEGDDRYNQYYIKRTYEKKYSEYGSVFIDYRSTDDVHSRNVIMHGHDMLDGSMFAGMLKYSPKGDLKGDLDYYREHPVISFNTPEGNAKYKIISVFKTSTRYEHGEFFNYMQGEFNSDAEFMNFVYNTRVRSFFNIPVTCNEDDQIITLSTCCYEFYQWRMVIVARKVRDGEDENVNVDLASINSSPLFPDVYYQRYGGTRPEEETFKSADKKGLIDWYDGKGNLKGSEELTATLAANPTDPPTEKPKKGEKKPTEPPVIVYYQVTYLNFDGSQFAAYNVKEGDPMPVPENKPKRPDEGDYTFTFDGWDVPSGVDTEHLNCSVSIAPKFSYELKSQ